jgi:ABC-2 type transport system ATP-binding protein
VVVILSTHIVQDVRELCTHMAIMDKGRILYSGTTDDALDLVKDRIHERRIERSELPAYESTHRVISHKLVAGKPLLHVYADQAQVDGFVRAEATLEDVYFSKLNGLV